MKYETPELVALTSAIDAIQDGCGKRCPGPTDGGRYEDPAAYEDWE